MDVLRLTNTNFRPDLLIEGYSSMIWTERFNDIGEFELTTHLVDQTKSQLPLDSLISVRESREIMFVEDHNIRTDKDGRSQLVITGRSFMSFLECRGLDGTYQTPWQMQQVYMTAEAIAVYLYEIVINATGVSVLRSGGTRTIANAVPNLSISNSTTVTETRKAWWVQEGESLEPIRGLLLQSNLGLRGVRPRAVIDSAKIVTVSSTGIITNTNSTNWNARYDVYNGLDRSGAQAPAIPQLVFSYAAGHIDEPEYLASDRDYRNIVIVNSSIGRIVAYEDIATSPTSSGLNRRILFVDGGSPGGTDTTILTQQGQAEIKKRRRRLLFDGSISINSPYIFNRDYGLGDIVMVSAAFGFYSKMQVVEYVRTSDEDGDRGYPTLILYP